MGRNMSLFRDNRCLLWCCGMSIGHYLPVDTAWISEELNVEQRYSKLKLIKAFTKDGPWTIFCATLFILLLTVLHRPLHTVSIVPFTLHAGLSRVLASSHIATEVLHAACNFRTYNAFLFIKYFDLVREHNVYNSCLKISPAFIFSFVQNIEA
jgi:hypothetical protein